MYRNPAQKKILPSYKMSLALFSILYVIKTDTLNTEHKIIMRGMHSIKRTVKPM